MLGGSRIARLPLVGCSVPFADFLIATITPENIVPLISELSAQLGTLRSLARVPVLEITEQFIRTLDLSGVTEGASAYEQLVIREGGQLETTCLEPTQCCLGGEASSRQAMIQKELSIRV